MTGGAQRKRSPGWVALAVASCILFAAMAGGLGFMGWKVVQLSDQVDHYAAVAASTTSLPPPAPPTTSTTPLSTTSTTADPWNGNYDAYQTGLRWFLDKRETFFDEVKKVGWTEADPRVWAKLADLANLIDSLPKPPQKVAEAQSSYQILLSDLWQQHLEWYYSKDRSPAAVVSSPFLGSLARESDVLDAWLYAVGRSR